MKIDFEKLRAAKNKPAPEMYSVITVRLSPDLHGRLRDWAHQEKVSLNQLCIAVLLAAAEEELAAKEEPCPQ